MGTIPLFLQRSQPSPGTPGTGRQLLRTVAGLLVGLAIVGELTAQPRDQVLVRGGMVITNEWVEGGVALGGTGSLDFSFGLGERWGVEFGGGYGAIPLGFRYSNRTCPGACPEVNPSPGTMLSMSGSFFAQPTRRVALLVGVNRTHSPTHAGWDEVEHSTVWGAHAALRGAPWRNPDASPMFEFRITRWEHRLGEVRWLFAPMLVMRL